MTNGIANDNTLERSEAPTVVETVEDLSEGIFEILWRRRWTILLTVLACLAAGLVYLQQVTPLYTSISRLYVEQIGPQVWERDASGQVTRWTNYLYTQAELLKSTPILAAALDAPDISQMKTFAEFDNPIAYMKKKIRCLCR